MKNLLSLFLLITSLGLNAQITFEHTYESVGISPYHFYTDSDVFYYSFNNNLLMIYNSDHSIYKEVSITPEMNYKNNGIYCASDKLFNNDNLIEFIVVSYNSSTTEYSMKLYNENGDLIKDFGNRYYAWIISKDYSTKLMVSKTHYNVTAQQQQYTADVYSLPGVPAALTTILKSYEIAQPAYPNPSSTIITIPYKLDLGTTSILRIYNSMGQLIEQKKIDSTFDNILLNVESYTPDTYIYEYNRVTNRFIVN